MFRQLAQLFPGNLVNTLPASVNGPFLSGTPNANGLLAAHPYALNRLMERAWLEYERFTNVFNVQPFPPAAGMPVGVFMNEGNGAPIDFMPLALPFVGLPYVAPWDHLIYAYFVENTRAFEIFRRVVKEFVTGERLLAPPNGNDPAMVWVRAAEDLWLRDGASFPISSIISQVRPDFGGTRRNAYFRLFGIDLNHGADDGRPYGFEKPEIANRDFIRLFESLLSSVWVARVNRANAIGTNPTDPAEIARTAKLLQELLNLRKQGGQLRREEFVIVSMMSWFHLTLSFDSPIVRLLNSNATTPGERLIRLGQKVGIAAHPRSREFFDLASDMSTLLKLIESGVLSSAVTVPWLYETWSPLTPIVDRIVNVWGLVTGRDLKASATRLNVPSAAPQLPPATISGTVVGPGLTTNVIRN